MYGFLVHGCIDGGPNYCVYATLAFNKQGSTLRDVFDKAVGEYGYPLRMRADMVFEATFVGQRMLDERGAGSFITALQHPIRYGYVGLMCDIIESMFI